MPDSYRKLQSMEMEKRMDEEFELDERKTKTNNNPELLDKEVQE